MSEKSTVQFIHRINSDEVPEGKQIQNVKPLDSKPNNFNNTRQHNVEFPKNKENVNQVSMKHQKLKSIDSGFTRNITQEVVSRVANLIKYHIQHTNLFGHVKHCLIGEHKNITPDKFYKEMGSSIYHSLLNYIGFEKGEDGVPIPLLIEEDDEIYPTVIFLKRIYYNREFHREMNPEIVLKKYHELYDGYDDNDGIQLNWFDYLNNKIAYKFLITDAGVNLVDEFFENHWCRSSDIPSSDDCTDELETDIQTNLSNENDTDDEEDDDEGKCLSIDMHYGQGNESLIILIHHLCILQNEKEIPITIPLYINLKEHDLYKIYSDKSSGGIDNKNGDWNFLINFQPQVIFETEDPDNYVGANDDEKSSYFKVIILRKEGSKYIMGVYKVDPKLGSLKNGNEDLRILNYFIQYNINATDISHLERSLTMKQLYKTEQEIVMEAEEMSDGETDGEDFEEDQDDQEELLSTDNDLDPQSKAAMETIVNEEEKKVEVPAKEDEFSDPATDEVDDENKNINTIQVVTREDKKESKDNNEPNIIPVRSRKNNTINRDLEEEHYFRRSYGRGD
jgi:hypothetical protein